MKVKGISNKVLATEIRVAIDQIDNHNFGYAKQILEQILVRVNSYILKEKPNDE